MIYKVSYVVIGSQHPGAIMNHTERPKVGDQVEIGHYTFQIIEIQEMMSARNDFQFLHATVRQVPESKPEEELEPGE